MDSRVQGEDLTGKRVLVFGAGRSGFGACTLLLSSGAVPVLYDGNESLMPEKVRENFLSSSPESAPLADRIQVVTGQLKEELIRSVSLCVISPGVPTDIDPVNRIRDAKVPIWGEV